MLACETTHLLLSIINTRSGKLMSQQMKPQGPEDKLKTSFSRIFQILICFCVAISLLIILISLFGVDILQIISWSLAIIGLLALVALLIVYAYAAFLERTLVPYLIGYSIFFLVLFGIVVGTTLYILDTRFGLLTLLLTINKLHISILWFISVVLIAIGLAAFALLAMIPAVTTIADVDVPPKDHLSALWYIGFSALLVGLVLYFLFI